MSISSKSSKKEASPQKEETSKVLLVCVYDTLVIEVTNAMIHDKFRRFGNIVKLLIFEKGEVTKFFIEYSEIEQAVKAKRQLEGTKLLSAICKMNIYFSNFTNVDLKNQTSEGADYTQEKQLHQNFMQKYDLLTKSSPQSDADGFNDLIMHSFEVFNPFSRSKTDNPIHLAREISLMEISKEDRIGEQNQFDFQIKSNIESILNSNSNSDHSQHMEMNELQFKKEHSVSSQTKLKENTVSNGTVLYFQYVRHLQIRHVYNLFSNFGNIAGINKKKQYIYIKFRTLQFSAISFTYLNDFILMGNTLSLKYADNQTDFHPKQNQFCELVYFDYSYDRFTPHKSITINSPSKTLHVSSLKKEVCRDKTLRNIFQEYGEVETVLILKQSADKNMALVKFYSFQDSFRAIAQLHNSVFSGRKMQISFTKSRI